MQQHWSLVGGTVAISIPVLGWVAGGVLALAVINQAGNIASALVQIVI